MAAEKNANDMKTAVAGSIGAGAGIIVGTMLGVAALPIAGTTLSLFSVAGGGVISNLAIAGGAAGVAAAPVIAATFAVAVGVAEGVQVIESEKNWQRYQDFKAVNKPLTALYNFDLKNRYNLAQAMLAIQGMLTQSFSKVGA